MLDEPSEDPARFRWTRAVFAEALQLPAAQRDAYLVERCGEDVGLLERLRALLAGYEEEDPLFDRPADEPVVLGDKLARNDPRAWAAFLEQLRSRGPAWTRYRDEGELGHGGMGAVHRVRDQDLGRVLALKRILPEKNTGEPVAEQVSLGRFLEEAQVTSQLDHPGIVPVHEIGLDDAGRVYFTMKLVKGESLSRIIERVHDRQDGEWTMNRALGVLLRILEAMAYAHAKGVLHRDLKPANVMVGRYGETYVVDWGLARLVGQEDRKDLRIRDDTEMFCVRQRRNEVRDAAFDSPLVTMDGDVVGTPAYMPPEQAQGRLDEMGPWSDVYAAGAILYHLLTGTMPYVLEGERPSPRALLALVQAGPPAPIHQVAPAAPPELAAICEKAMARPIGRRYATMGELAEHLRAYLENRVVPAYETGPIAELRKWVVRNQGTAATAAVALIGALLLASWALLERNTARSHATTAVARKTEFDQLAGVVLLEQALAREQELSPAWPERIDAMERWLAQDAARLLALRPELERTVAELERRASAESAGRGADPALAAGAAPRFADESQRFLHDTLAGVLADIKVFEQEDVPNVEAHLSWARRIEELTLRHPRARATWEEARSAIARADGAAASVLYRDHPVDLQPQWGLVPIGMNPVTGLWEFYDLRTAYDPKGALDPGDIEIPAHREDGGVEVAEATGLVFVLVPGGTFWMGSQKEDAAAPSFDPDSIMDETPVHAVTLQPFFLARHEMTQGQWLRVTGSNPAYYGPRNYGGNWSASGRTADLAQPVEMVSWEHCSELLARLGLCLPTEAQWEYAARAGTSTPWWTGEDRASLAGCANLADGYGRTHGAEWTEWEQGLDDGNTVHARVGSYRANAFGLFDVIGNVSEWCRDGYADYTAEPRSGDVEVDPASFPGRAARGGSYMDLAVLARSAVRIGYAPGGTAYHLGCRPARVLRR